MAAPLDIQAIRRFIVEKMQAQEMSRRGLSMAAGIGQTAVRDLLERTENPGVATLQKVAAALDVPLESMLSSRQVPLVGRIGAGGAVAYQADNDDFEMVDRPPGLTGMVIALEVLGDSMLPKYEAGDVIYIAQDQLDQPESQLGRYCAIRLVDGGTYLKRLTGGSRADRFTLQSLNAGDLVDVEVQWAAPVLFIMPRRSR